MQKNETYPTTVFVYTKGLCYEDLNKFNIINNKKYLEFCNDKEIQNLFSIVICSDFQVSKLTLFCLKKYYAKNFLISSEHAYYFVTASKSYSEGKIKEITENLCTLNSFTRHSFHYPINTEYALHILEDFEHNMNFR